MPQITVHTYAGLRDYTGGASSVQAEIVSGDTVGSVMAQLNIPEAVIRIIFVDHKLVSPDLKLNGGEQLELFPAVGGG